MGDESMTYEELAIWNKVAMEGVPREALPAGQQDRHPGWPVHWAAELLPPLGGLDVQNLAESIARNGILSPVKLLDGEVIDGRTRYHIWSHLVFKRGLDIKLPSEEIETNDPVEYVLASNVHRRQLSKSQLAALADRLATLEVGQKSGQQEEAISRPITREGAADMLGVSRAYLARFRAIRQADEGLAGQVARGILSIPDAEGRIKPKQEEAEAPVSTESASAPVGEAQTRAATRETPSRDRPSESASGAPSTGGLTPSDRAARVIAWLRATEVEGDLLWHELEHRITREIAEAVTEATVF